MNSQINTKESVEGTINEYDTIKTEYSNISSELASKLRFVTDYSPIEISSVGLSIASGLDSISSNLELVIKTMHSYIDGLIAFDNFSEEAALQGKASLSQDTSGTNETLDAGEYVLNNNNEDKNKETTSGGTTNYPNNSYSPPQNLETPVNNENVKPSDENDKPLDEKDKNSNTFTVFKPTNNTSNTPETPDNIISDDDLGNDLGDDFIDFDDFDTDIDDGIIDSGMFGEINTENMDTTNPKKSGGLSAAGWVVAGIAAAGAGYAGTKYIKNKKENDSFDEE